MTSDESLDGRSEASYNRDIKGIPGKKSWRRQAKKWTKRTKKKTNLENKSSGEGSSKFEKCLKNKTKKLKVRKKNPSGELEDSESRNENEIPTLVGAEEGNSYADLSDKFKNSAFHQSLAQVGKYSTNKPLAEVQPIQKTQPKNSHADVDRK